MRTFLALDIPPEIKRDILKEISDLREFQTNGLKWVSDNNLHITLQFIGKVDPSGIAEIVHFLNNEFQHLTEIDFKISELQLVPGKKPRLGWIHLNTQDVKIIKLIKEFRKFLQLSGYEIENKKLKFHITLFRIKKMLPEFFINRILTTELKKLDFEVSSATLYESILRPEGPNYYEIAKFKFTKE